MEAVKGSHSVVLIPGDGIGPEVTAEALRVLSEVARRGGHEFPSRSGSWAAAPSTPTGRR